MALVSCHCALELGDFVCDGFTVMDYAVDTDAVPPVRLDLLNEPDVIKDWFKVLLSECHEPANGFDLSAGWLLDNEHQVLRALAILENELPPTFYRVLPRLKHPAFAGLPRAYYVAQQLLTHTRLQLSYTGMQEYLQAVQNTWTLNEAELWAMPTLLRVACIEHLCLAVIELLPEKSLPFRLHRDAVSHENLPPDERVSGAIASLRVLADTDWNDLVGSVSVVEAMLQQDPSTIYPVMKQSSRNAYRREVEHLSRYSGLSETALVERVLAWCHEVEVTNDASSGHLQSHVGYWLIEKGRARLEEAIGYRAPVRRRLLSLVKRHAGVFYTFLLIVVSACALGVPSLYLSTLDTSLPMLFGIVFLSIFPAIDIAVQFVHWLLPQFTDKATLHSLDRHKLDTQDCRCAVVVPVIVRSVGEVESLIDKLELRYLANTEDYLHYVLLSDPADASEPGLPGDAAIDEALVQGVRILNNRYAQQSGHKFLLLHRTREFNASENCWMAWERKRGKIEQFNALLLKGESAHFPLIEGDISQLKGVKYVITLDADTMLPPGCAADLVCMFEHPLNQPVTDKHTGRLIAGYTMLQPRIETLDIQESMTRFAKLYTGNSAIDIYSHAVSDFHQDWFGNGSFVGKGIYHVESFFEALEGRVPENRILSHDLFEGLHGRVALVSDIVLYESFPRTWQEHSDRRHRWVRGDWQLLSWIGKNVPGPSDQSLSSVFSVFDQWKLLDNLRRSVMPPLLLLYLLGAWFWFPGSAVVWSLLALAAFAPYLVNEALTGMALVSRGAQRHGYVHNLKQAISRWAVSIALIIPDALLVSDAIVRTLWRMFVSGKHRLQWRSSAHVAQTQVRMPESNNSSDRKSHHHGKYRPFFSGSDWIVWFSPFMAVIACVALLSYRPQSLLVSAPVLLAWFMAPWLVHWLGAPRVFRRDQLDAQDKAYLRRVARSTWHFFEQFTGPADNWLPPDNFQQHASVGVAHRTSPTNIGLYLTSAVAAHDLGFIGPQELVIRVERVMETLSKLETHRGHVLNWYDTRSLEPLLPRYVSTVDSGNLAMCLIATAHGIRDCTQRAVFHPCRWQGLVDTLHLMRSAADSLARPLKTDTQRLLDDIDHRLNALASRSDKLEFTVFRFRTLAGWSLCADQMHREMLEHMADDLRLVETIRTWMERFDHQMQTLFRDVHTQLPWLLLLDSAPSGYESLIDKLLLTLADGYPFLYIDALNNALQTVIRDFESEIDIDADQMPWLAELKLMLLKGAKAQQEFVDRVQLTAESAENFAWSMDFKWLFDRHRRQFHIGHNVTSGELDANHYDLLASEARIASFFAIAKHDVPLEHWFRLGRPLIRYQSQPVLRSWNGSMFEYLMPPLFLPGKRDTLLGESESLAVLEQQRFARKIDVPWGVSESAYAITDAENNYQYKAFGTPGLGIRRGLAADTVVAPYASMLALGVWPHSAVKNLRLIEAMGAMGSYGFVDALDFTSDRHSTFDTCRLVTTWMAHHQGMSMLAMLNVLEDDRMPRLVQRDQRLRAVELLLQERVPWDAPDEPVTASGDADGMVLIDGDHRLVSLTAWLPTRNIRVPNMHLLGNGELSATLSSDGGSVLQYRDYSLTRQSTDQARAHLGYRIHVRQGLDATDEQKKGVWLGQTKDQGSPFETLTRYFQHAVEWVQRGDNLTLRYEALVAASVNIDIRRISVVNESQQEREWVFTSFAEVVLAPKAAHDRHPAFSKLFVKSRAETDLQGISFAREARGSEDSAPIMLHRLVTDNPKVRLSGFESDRHCWFGRSSALSRTQDVPESLSGSSGWVLDPIMALQVSVTLSAGESASFVFVTAVGEERRAVRELSRRYAPPAVDRLFQDMPVLSAREASQLKLADVDLPHLQTLASLIIYPDSTMRDVASASSITLPNQSYLWRYGISGELPLVLLRVDNVAESALLDTLVRAQVLWRRRGLKFDLGVFPLSEAGYDDPLRIRVLDVLRTTGNSSWLGRDGGVHIFPASQMLSESRARVFATAVVILDAHRSLSEQLAIVLNRVPVPTPLIPSVGMAAPIGIDPIAKVDDLLFDNELGGFDPETAEYVMHLEPGRWLPSAWCNILANKNFGAIVSEAGSGFTWSGNSGEHRLTPWSNDPVLDYQGEQLWMRDEVRGECWTTAPCNQDVDTAVQVRHGFGYTRWYQNSHALEQTLTVLVPVDDPVKLYHIRLINRDERIRRLTVTFYCEWVMEAIADAARNHVVATYDPELQTILARNHWHDEHEQRVAFVSSSLPAHSVSGDRADFVNLLDPMHLPDGMRRSDLGGNFTAGKESCAAYQVHVDLAPGESTELVFILGEGVNTADVGSIVSRWTSTSSIDAALVQLSSYWKEQTQAVQVLTPDPAFDLMINRWLPYQCVSSRLHARAGFYQAGGAFGFRDQLQDVLASLASDPQRVRQQLLLAAAHQFEEGDVLHWWHPPGNKGVRTRISDDFLWLAYVTARYLKATGDVSLLDVDIPFLKAPLLSDDEMDRYASYTHESTGTLFDHCCRAIDHGLSVGIHGLPLIGSGDWNDGMDKIGHHGRGESVWLAWFHIATIELMIPIARSRNELHRVTRWQQHIKGLKLALDEHAWDGEWFVRAFDDEGIPWGSMHNDECRIDLIAQAWGVLAGFGNEARVKTAMASLERYLLDGKHHIARLLTPSFEHTLRDPGYIKSYPPGIRENGGQYSHAAAWLGLAYAMQGNGDKAYDVFNMISPIHHASTEEDAMRYAREPYVVSADIGGADPYVGRGGWSWYTGAASWTWQLGVNGILGIEFLPDAVRVEPVIPKHWKEVQLFLKGNNCGCLVVHIDNASAVGQGIATITIDGRASASNLIRFPENDAQRQVVICLG